jgi:hypothetical protein
VSARAALVAACVALCAPAARAAGPAFDGARAWKDLQALVAVGPRRAGTDGARRARGLIVERLRQAGFAAREAAFQPGLANAIGERAGRTRQLVLLATHFDAADVPAANESASGAALVLEVARALAAVPLERTLRLVFFDAHEAFDPAETDPALAGSRALAAQMDRDGELARVRALVVVSRVADRDLHLETSVLAAPELVARALAVARTLDPPPPLEPIPRAHFDDDHLPFVRRGLRAVLPLVDLRFGPGDPPGDWTHTPSDAPPNASRQSLGRAGVFVLALVRSLAAEP